MILPALLIEIPFLYFAEPFPWDVFLFIFGIPGHQNNLVGRNLNEVDNPRSSTFSFALSFPANLSAPALPGITTPSSGFAHKCH
jgi:hypothetical protein